MKHIVIDARNMPTSTGRYVEMLVRYLEKIDHDHRYSILMYPDKMDKWQPTNPNFSAVACPHKEFSFAEQIGMKQQLESLQPDLVHFSMVQQPVFYSGKVVTTMQDLTTIRFRNPAKNWLIFTIKRWVYIWVNKRAADKSAAIITPTEFVKNDVVAYTGISPDKVTFTHEAVDDFDDAPEEMPFFRDKRFIMFNGRPTPHKNLRRLIQAFAKVHQNQPDLYLMLAGRVDETYDSYVALIRQLGLQDFVILTDFIPDGQLKWAMRNAQAHVYPSLSEGFGLPPLEAMLQGCPAITSKVSCMPEVCGDAAAYLDPYDIDDMARVIEQVISDQVLRQQMIAKGREQVKKYSWERMARQTLDVYTQVLGE